MKQVIYAIVALFVAFASPASAQTTTTISELVFQNPVLTSGVAAHDGAIYKFSNVATGIDATIQVKARSSSAVVLNNIDVSNLGWNKAFQPELGLQGMVCANQNWWMDFEVVFYKAGTTQRQQILSFNATAIDVDGDGVSIQEYLQMNKTKSVTYCPVNYLTETSCTSTTALSSSDAYNIAGTDKKVMGPVSNYANIDTLGTPVMCTYKFENKDMISFRYGAKSGYSSSNAGMRLNSLWFKAFTLRAPSTLPIAFYSFTAAYDKKNVTLNWSADTKDMAGNFVIERSNDGNNFTAVGTLPGNGTNMGYYNFKDANVNSATGIVYYRIVSKENTSEIRYSSIKVVRLNKDNAASLSVYPNPVQTQANLTLPNSWQGKAITISIYNGAGMELQTRNISTASQTESLDFGRMSKGIYVVKAQCDGEVAEQRIVKY